MSRPASRVSGSRGTTSTRWAGPGQQSSAAPKPSHNPGNGQLLADIDGNPNTGLSCGYGCVTYGVAYTYVSEGPASSPPAGQ